MKECYENTFQQNNAIRLAWVLWAGVSGGSHIVDVVPAILFICFALETVPYSLC